MNNKLGRFKAKGAKILATKQPNSMESFLRNDPNTHNKNTENLKNTDTQLHKSTPDASNDVIRQDFELRKEIVKILETEKTKRKLNGKHGATKRAIVEEAIENLLKN